MLSVTYEKKQSIIKLKTACRIALNLILLSASFIDDGRLRSGRHQRKIQLH